MSHYFFTSEAVSRGHPDKVADQISDAILDACLSQDPNSRVACETLITNGLVVLAGEITTKADINYEKIARNTIRSIGYTCSADGMDWKACGVISSIQNQSLDIAMGVDKETGLHKEQGAGDQGIVFGYACDETKQLMPLPITLAQELINHLLKKRISSEIDFLKPDAKSQVTIEYDSSNTPVRIDTIVLSTQHSENVSRIELEHVLRKEISELFPKELLDKKTIYHINPTGRFVLGGPAADSGLTGRKPIVDTYGGRAHHGGGAFSGKDPSKIDRSAAYLARNIAKTIVHAKLAKRCEIQLAYAIGVAEPVSIKIDTQRTGNVDEETLRKAVLKVFTLTPKGVEKMFDLKRPIYQKTAQGGHFGNPEFPWEKVTLDKKLIKAIKLHHLL